jgi:REP element-mobilizing transposase RayT
MARPLRIEFSDAIYHVTGRGIERRAIVRDRRDRDRWVERLEQTVRRRRWRLFAFALMNNHFHLFLQTPDPNLSAGMHDLNAGHAGYFNIRHQRVGPLFQGRFKAILIEGEGHWLEVSRYVHLNPCRAGLAASPDRWTWSSYPGYHDRRWALRWIDYAPVLGEFGGTTSLGRRRYGSFVQQGLDEKPESPFSTALHGLVLGSGEFFSTVRDTLEAREPDPELPQLHRMKTGPSPEMDTIVRAVVEQFPCNPTAWRRGRRCDDLARSMAAYLARELTSLSTREIADALGYRGPSSTSMACRRAVKELKAPATAKALRRAQANLGVGSGLQ